MPLLRGVVLPCTMPANSPLRNGTLSLTLRVAAQQAQQARPAADGLQKAKANHSGERYRHAFFVHEIEAWTRGTCRAVSRKKIYILRLSIFGPEEAETFFRLSIFGPEEAETFLRLSIFGPEEAETFLGLSIFRPEEAETFLYQDTYGCGHPANNITMNHLGNTHHSTGHPVLVALSQNGYYNISIVLLDFLLYDYCVIIVLIIIRLFSVLN